MEKQVLANLSYGVYLCTTWDNGRPTGCVANSAMQITSDPATIAVSVNRENYTHRCIEDCGYFAITILREDSDPKLIGTFGFLSGKTADKFENFSHSVRGKLPVVSDGLSYLSCKVVGKLETKTHTVFLGEVFDAGPLKKGTPMTYSYYHKVLKGKTSEKAPTYSASEKFEKEGNMEKGTWVCTVCGYEYDGEVPFEELPDDWVCPLCGVGKEMFEKRD